MQCLPKYGNATKQHFQDNLVKLRDRHMAEKMLYFFLWTKRQKNPV